jgi:hypothetical protein
VAEPENTTAPEDLRHRMPQRRESETFRLRHIWGRATPTEQAETMLVKVGHYPDGRIGEVFLYCDNHHNERAITLWHDIGVLVSIALQYGASIEELSAAMTRGEVNVMGKMQVVPGSPAGTVLEALLSIERTGSPNGGNPT